ncbi:MAG: DUF4982 domain-containing protein [Bacteroidales bacterium]|nr:DUF4982 domain-containing protein [Bacteroidales bacterium]
MKKLRYLFLLGLALALVSGCQTKKLHEGRVITNFNKDWQFAKDLPDSDYALSTSGTTGFLPVTLPHTPRIEPLVVNDQWMGTAWYRKTFSVAPDSKDRKYFLYFEGAMQNADVYLNGKHIYRHEGGYLPFEIPISDELNYTGPNLLAVKLVNTDDSLVPPGKPLKALDFNRYGGIYRDVELISTYGLRITNPLSAKENASGGVFVVQDTVNRTQAKMTIKTQVVNQENEEKNFHVIQVLKDRKGKVVARLRSKTLSLEPGKTLDIVQQMNVQKPELWSPEYPYQYSLETRVLRGNKLEDNFSQKIGLRSVVLKSDGIYINGVQTFLNGTNRHQEYPYVGYALSDEAQWRDAVKIKDAGFNMVRLSHYPQSEAFMDACDSLGIVTMDAIPGWQFMGNEIFKKHVLKDVREMIRRDRNRASVFFWELSLNETWMQPSFMDSILAVKNEEFPTKKPIACAWIDYPGYDLFIPARQHAHPPNYWINYKDGKRPVFIAEYGDWEYYAQNAGFNQTQFKGLKPEDRSSRQPRNAGEERLLQQELNFQEAANSNEKGRYKGTVGQANWLMFDYNRGYTDDIETSGISDIFRLPKFSYYFYQSQRDASEPVTAPAKGGPMVYIASYWTKNSEKDVKVLSNCEEVELFLNEKSLGKQKPDHGRFSNELKHPPFTFHIDKFTPGTLKAVGYINNKAAAKYSVSTPGKPFALILKIDKSGIPLSNKHKDVVFIYAKVVDAQGTVCPYDSSLVQFSVKGNARLAGENPFRAQAGIASIVLQTEPTKKPIVISATSKGLKQATIELKEGK